MRITALHGFLGKPADWDFLREAGFDIETPATVPSSGEVLLGYSLGGRMALHGLLAGARFARAVIVSARVSAAVPDRAARDEAWAQRFERDEWETLMRHWNAQGIFGGHAMPREERDFDRAQLARTLRESSPAALPTIAPRLGEIEIPVLWIAGERDAKYVAEGKLAVSALPNARLWICPGAAHRVPWEQPRLFIDRLRDFLA